MIAQESMVFWRMFCILTIYQGFQRIWNTKTPFGLFKFKFHRKFLDCAFKSGPRENEDMEFDERRFCVLALTNFFLKFNLMKLGQP
jgi:hypothetical protein